MKKLFSAAIVLTIMMSLCMPSFAMDITMATAEEASLTQARALAYMDMTDVDAATKHKILEAREKVILSESWVADGVSGRILDKNGRVKEELPQFSELFPDDWEMPTFSVSNGDANETEGTRGVNQEWINTFFEGNLNLKKPSTTVNSPSFCSFSSAPFAGTQYEYIVETVYTWGVYQNPTVTASYNIGYSNENTGASLGLATRLENGETFAIDLPYNVQVAVRASTYDSVGDWYMRVDAACSDI